MMDSWDVSYVIGLRWFSLELTEYKSTLVQVMVWCKIALKWLKRPTWRIMLHDLDSYIIVQPLSNFTGLLYTVIYDSTMIIQTSQI